MTTLLDPTSERRSVERPRAQRHDALTGKVIALLDKPSRRVKSFKADYVGFEVANQFVVGYGMDHAERYRNLPDIRFVPSA